MSNKYEIKEVEKDIVIKFVQTYHYSKILPRLTKHYLGVFEKEEMIGAITLGWGTNLITISFSTSLISYLLDI